MPTDPGHFDMAASGGWFAAGASLLLGWVMRGFRAGASYGTLEQKVQAVLLEQAEQKVAFASHIAKDTEDQRQLHEQLSNMARDLNQLIGFVHANKDGL